MRYILITLAALDILFVPLTVGSTRTEQQKPVQIEDKNHPCYKAIIKLQIQIASLKETAKNFVSKRYAIRKVKQKDPSTLKTYLAEIQNVSGGLISLTEQFQGSWRQWCRDCATTNANKKFLVDQLSSIRGDLTAIMGILDNQIKDELGNDAGQQNSCGHCYSPWQQHCDLYQCQQCCTKCPPDPFDSCAVMCKINFELCIIAGITKEIDQTSKGIIRNL